MSPEPADEIVELSSDASSDGANRFGITRIGFVATNIFIVCWFAITAIQVSPPGKLHDTLEDLLLPAVDLIKFNQHWNMFSPTVRDFNEHGESVITFADGSVKLYEWYRLDKQDPFHHWLHGKMRELWTDQLLDDKLMDHLYPSIGRYMSRANLFPGNQPQRVSLSANWQRIPDFSHFTRVDDLPQDFNHYTLGCYKVRAEDLK
jgi:hypothetical protein